MSWSRVLSGPWVTSESTSYVGGLEFSKILRRDPLASVPEVMLPMFRCQGIYALAIEGNVRTVRVHVAVLGHRMFYVPINEVVVELQHAQHGVLQDEKTCGRATHISRFSYELSTTTLRSRNLRLLKIVDAPTSGIISRPEINPCW